ncbi:hypothetical protein ACJ41O_007535 [Fusarium nematophilum]
MSLLQYLRGLLSRPPRRACASDPRGDLKVIPHELILMVAEHLPDTALLSLSLSCRPYHQLLSREFRSVELSTRDREEFLQWIEKDVAQLYFCFKCVKLHRWNRRWDSRGCWRPPAATNDCLAGFEYRGDYRWQSHIRYRHARLVMNRHLHGASHGLPLKTLEHDSGTMCLGRGGRARWVTNARIVDAELFVRRTLTIWYPGRSGSNEKFREFLRWRVLWLCTHVTTTGPEYRTLYSLPELRRPAEDLALCRESLGSCPMCLMDYSATVTRSQGRNPGWLVKIDVYQQLGGCRTPFDWKWRILSRGCSHNQPRSAIEEPGIVRHRWSLMDRVTFPPEGDFIGRACQFAELREIQCSYHVACHSERIGDPHSEYGSC